MSQQNHYCVDRVIPDSFSRSSMRMLANPNLGSLHFERAILVINKMWPNGATLRVSFMGGSPAEHNKVKNWAMEWTQYANINFDFNNDADAEIRVGFVQGDGSWSAVGTDSLNRTWFPLNEPTMNFGWELEKGTVLHEFGHAIGLGHEHQNPAGGLRWNEQVVINALRRSPNNWSPEQTRHNVLRKYEKDQVNGTEFDPDSIMLYFFPASWTLNGVGTHANEVLSDTDKNFIGSSSAYPKELAASNDLVLNGPAVEAAIGEPGEEDQFRFTIVTPGFYNLETSGKTDVVMRLFGPGNETTLVAEDDDGGMSFNAKIARDLEPGNYMVQIRHYWNQSGTGAYSLRLYS